MNYDLFLSNPKEYFPILFVSLAMTLIAYAAFPVIFAKTRKVPVTKKKYRWFCFGVNIAVMLGFAILNGRTNGAPYLLWTWFFSNYGIKVLRQRSLLTGNKQDVEEPERWTECKVCGYRSKDMFYECPQCGKYASPYQNSQEKKSESGEGHFCRKCGEKLMEGSRFCRKCGAEVVNVYAERQDAQN